MNTERPDNDDAEARASGSARDTGGASASADGPTKDAPEQQAPDRTPASGSATPGDAVEAGAEADAGKAPEPSADGPETTPAGEAAAARADGGEGPENGDAQTDATGPLEPEDAKAPEGEPGTPSADDTKIPAPEAAVAKTDDPEGKVSETGAPVPEGTKLPEGEPEAPSVDDTDNPAPETTAAEAGGNEDRTPKNEPSTADQDQGEAPQTETPQTETPQTSDAKAGATRAGATEPQTPEPEDTKAPEGEREASGREPGETPPDRDGQPAAVGGGAEVPEGDAAGSEPAAPQADTPQADAPQAAVRPESGSGADRDGDRGGAGRRRSPVLVASVAAAVLLVGGGGAYLAAGAVGGPGDSTVPGATGEATPPPLTLDAYAEGGPHGIAPGEPNPYGAAYRADGALPEGPDSAPVYRARGQITEAQVAGLAKALDVDGKPVAEGDSWRIGGKDGSGPTLRVDRNAPGTWTFSRYAPGTDDCKGETCRTPPADADDAPAVTEEAARKAAAPVLKALGQDDAKLDAGQVMGVKRVVNAEPEVGGLPTHGWTTGVVVGAGGEVVGGSGRLSTPVKGDTYPVVSAEKALELMNTAPGSGDRAEIGGCATPVPLGGEQQEQSEPCVTATTLPATDTVTVDEAVFGLAAHSVDGRQALVPSWLFETRPTASQDGGTVTYPAVEPEYLTSGARPGESGTGRPTEPGDGDEPTSAPSPREVGVEGYTAEGSELTVTFTGGVCADYEATASERGDRVAVTVTETPWPGKVCILIAKQYQQTVRLDAPLGTREVVDADGEPVPLHKDGARLPTAPSSGRTR
ncbi:hypothetical protein [Streptomyces cathayae]|uniref:hypothetical protein n=1 Tax=Streptomyces cathayae TaxID=3031124 RepID=UPI003C6F30CF